MERTWKPVVAGVLNLVAGAFVLIGGITVLGLLGQPTMAIPWANYAMYSLGLEGTPSTSFVTKFIVALGVALVVPGVVSILGGIYSLRRNLWGLALAGAIFSLFYLPPLGIPAIIFTALSREEFA